MTGAYLRIKRNGKFENVEIEHLTDEERDTVFGPNDLLPWLNMTCKKIAEIEEIICQLIKNV